MVHRARFAVTQGHRRSTRTSVVVSTWRDNVSLSNIRFLTLKYTGRRFQDTVWRMPPGLCLMVTITWSAVDHA